MLEIVLTIGEDIMQQGSLSVKAFAREYIGVQMMGGAWENGTGGGAPVAGEESGWTLFGFQLDLVCPVPECVFSGL